MGFPEVSHAGHHRKKSSGSVTNTSKNNLSCYKY